MRDVLLRGGETRLKSATSVFRLNKTRVFAEEFDVQCVISEEPFSMPVFKRAVSLMLSIVLVYSPSLVWAREAATPPKRFTAESPEAYEKQLNKHLQKAATQKTHSSKTTTHKQVQVIAKAQQSPAKEKRHPAGKREQLQSKFDQAIGTMYRPVHFKGEDYTVTQVAGRGKRLKSQMIKGKDFEEIMVDENNTGTASLWKVTKGLTEITASHPYKGTFSQIDIRQRRAKAFINAHLQINPDLKTYRIANYRIEPFHVDHYEPQIALACTSQLTDKSSTDGIDSLKTLLANIGGDHATPQAALQCKLSHLQEAFFDKSCYAGKFAGSAAPMSQAVANIFGSLDPNHKGKARYLQCLNEQGFAYYAAQMEGDFVAMTTTAGDAADNDTVRPLASSMSEANICTPIDRVDILAGQTVLRQQSLADLPPQLGLYRPFTCDETIHYDSDFRQDTTRQVAFSLSAAQMAQPKNYGNAVDGYAFLMFHELLHKAGIPQHPNESLVDQLQNCCADPDPNSKRSEQSCAELSVYAEQMKLLAVEDSPLAIYMHGYKDLSALANAQMGTQSEAFKAQWVAGLKADPDASKAWTELKRCDDASPNDTSACDLSAQRAIKKYNDQFMDRQCPKLKAKSDTKYSISCSGLKATFDNNLKRSNQTSVPVPILGGSVEQPLIAYVPWNKVQNYEDSFKAELAAANLGLIANSSDSAQADAATTVATQTAEPDIVVTASPKAVAKAWRGRGAKRRKSNSIAQTKSGNSQSTDTNVQITGDGIDRNADADANAKKSSSDLAPTPDYSSDPTATNTEPVSGQPQAPDENPSTSGFDANENPTSTNSMQPAGSNYVPPARSNSGRAMPFQPTSAPISAAGALPASTGAYARSDENSIQTAAALANVSASAASVLGSTVIAPLINAVASSYPAYAEQIRPYEPPRAPASIAANSLSSNPAGTRAATQLSSGEESSEKASLINEKEKKSARPVEDGSQALAEGVPDQGSSRTFDPKGAAAEIQTFNSKQFSYPIDVVKALMDLNPLVLAHELDRPDSSIVLKRLSALGWKFPIKDNRKILMTPAGSCYARDSQRTLIYLKTCK